MGSFSKCTLSSKVLTLNVLLVGLFLLSFLSVSVFHLSPFFLGTDKVSGNFMLGCNCSWLMFLLKVLEHVYDCCFIERAPQFVCGLVFSFLYGWVSSFPCLLTDWLLLCCQTWNLCNLVIGSSFNSSQVDWNPKFLEILSTHEYIVSLICLWP